MSVSVSSVGNARIRFIYSRFASVKVERTHSFVVLLRISLVGHFDVDLLSGHIRLTRTFQTSRQ